MKKRAFFDQYGLSFMELVIALFLINVMFFSLIGVMASLLKGSKQVSSISKETIVANSILEEYTSKNAGRLKKSYEGSKTFGDLSYAYSITASRTDGEDFNRPGLFHVNIRVYSPRTEKSETSGAVVSISTLVYGCGQ